VSTGVDNREFSPDRPGLSSAFARRLRSGSDQPVRLGKQVEQWSGRGPSTGARHHGDRVRQQRDRQGRGQGLPRRPGERPSEIESETKALCLPHTTDLPAPNW